MSLQSRLTELAEAIGADVKQVQDQMLLLGSSTEYDPRSAEVLSSPVTNSTIVGANVFNGFTPEVGVTYLVEVVGAATTADITSGVRFSMAGPSTGLELGVVKFQTGRTATTSRLGYLDLNDWHNAIDGLLTPSLVEATALVRYSSTPSSGNVRFMMRSELDAIESVMLSGSFMRWRTVESMLGNTVIDSGGP